MMRISRELHCALAGIKVESFTTLQGYRRLPVLPAELKGDKPFSPFETFTLALFDTFAQEHHISRTYAANICSEAGLLCDRWKELRESAAELKGDDMHFGRAKYPYPTHPKPAIGTTAEIAEQHFGAISIITISASRVAYALASRAQRHGIDFDQFWAEPARPSPKRTAPSRDRVIARINARIDKARSKK